MANAVSTPSNGWWMTRRVLPFVLILVSAAVMGGLLRGAVLFVPGIAGMAVGGLTGYLCGRLGRDDSEACWGFSERGWMTLGAGVLYGVVTVATVSVLNVGAMGIPLEWLGDVVEGFRGELFAGWSKNSYQSVGGSLEGAWWIIFNLVDAALFMFLFLVTTGIGAAPEGSDEGDESADDAQGAEREDQPAAPAPIDARPLRSGLLTATSCLAVAVLSIVVLWYWPLLAFGAAGGRDAQPPLAGFQGEWVFGEGASFLGSTEPELHFTVSTGRMGELRCFSAVEAQYLISMDRQPDGSFHGLLFLRENNMLGIRMRASEEGDELVFVVKWPGARGDLLDRVMRARRVGAGPTDLAP